MADRSDLRDRDFERPPFLAAERMDEARYIRPSPVFGGISAGLYRNEGSHLGVSDANAEAAVYQLAVLFRGTPSHNGWQDGRYFRLPSGPPGAFACFDMRHQWQVELGYPFHSLHLYIPQAAFDDFARETGRSSVQTLSCSPTGVTVDPIVHHLTRALATLMDAPTKTPSLLSDQTFCALRTHLACRYGGATLSKRSPAGLSQRQVDRLQSFMLDDLERDLRLSDLADICGLPVSEFGRAFKAAFGLSPHQWRLARKIEHARKLIEYSGQSLSDIAALCGFADQSHLTRVFTRIVGMPPGAYRRVNRAG